ncbi:DUF3048 domain-containing protein [Peribacillus tepidiphilus]|uniref:DUF3048 domain-containing protein n=1 Tax=Peribacillus tepidiphilus TaxID=2652445 RepID=UPI0035B55C50
MKLKIITSCLMVSALLLVGCTKKDEVKQDPIKEDKVEQKVTTSVELKHIFPLTGVGTNENVDQRAIAVMVNNHPKARPQSGLQKADIVYEILAEGDVTRFLAVFQSEFPERVGPVRSARDYYMELAKGLDSIYINHGHSPDAKALLDKGYVDALDGMEYDGILFKRDKERKAPHNSYISFEKIEKGAKDNGFKWDTPPKEFTFLSDKEIETIQGASGTFTTINYGSPSFEIEYEYDATIGKYKRHSKNQQTIDHDTNEPVLLDNIFIIEASHKVMDTAGRRDIDLHSGGKAILLQKGKWNEIQWENREGIITPVKDGKVVGLVPGKTWVNVIPSKPGLSKMVSIGDDL